ncbi:hypothetical protein IGI37_003469 [Enterococcus sp. AZ194]|uniref:GNAT family N-acetyltransferase n=1 Tax=Enterococcus sp. AZ194 TaxID=2774629 RepID=UPI003F1F8E36
MNIQLATLYSKEHFEAITLREQVLHTEVDVKKEAKLTVFVAMKDGRVVGTASVQLYPFGIARVRQVAVSPEFQGKNIGNQLMDACEQFAKDQRHSKIILTGRITASTFYLKRDYRALLFPFKKHDIEFFWLIKNAEEPAHYLAGGESYERSY